MKELFNHIEQGRRLKKEDQKPGNIPFVMSGTTNQGVIGYISNPVASFPANAITIDIFGNTFYRSYAFGAGDDTGVYWSDIKEYSPNVMLFFSAIIGKSLGGKYSYGNKLRSSQSHDFKILLPINSASEIDFVFIENFLRELEDSRLRELEDSRLRELEAYLLATGLNDYELKEEDIKILNDFHSWQWKKFNVEKLFGKSTRGKRLKSDDRISGSLPFVTAGEAETGISAFIGNQVDVFSNNTTTIDMFGSAKYRNYNYGADDHIAVVHTENLPKHAAIFVTASCHKVAHNGHFDYGHNFYAKDADNLDIMLPSDADGKPDLELMEKIIAVVQKIVIADVAKYTAYRLDAAHSVVEQSEAAKTIEIHSEMVQYSNTAFESLLVAEQFERYKWEGFDQSIIDFFGGDKTILIGCYKGKQYNDWIHAHKLYNIRLGKTKGSMKENQELFEKTSLLILYELGKPNKLSAYKIVGHQEKSKEDLIAMDYPNNKPRKNYMTFNIEPVETDLTFLAEHHLIEKLIELNAYNAKGTPVFIEP